MKPSRSMQSPLLLSHLMSDRSGGVTLGCRFKRRVTLQRNYLAAGTAAEVLSSIFWFILPMNILTSDGYSYALPLL